MPYISEHTLRCLLFYGSGLSNSMYNAVQGDPRFEQEDQKRKIRESIDNWDEARRKAVAETGVR